MRYLEEEVVPFIAGSSIEITIVDLLEHIHNIFGEDVDLSKITLDIRHEQFKCFGYDLYNSGDYHIAIRAEQDKFLKKDKDDRI